LRRVMRVIERRIDKRGQRLLVPEIEIEGWWTSLEYEEETIIALYADHGTSEQFHSEFKSDLDIERLPSGKFATNALVLACAMLAYNILRWIGQSGLVGPDAPRRHRAKRRRLRTVMQELMYRAARLIDTARRIKLAFAFGCPVVGVFRRLYLQLAGP
ncbi:transposase, partial [Thiococcus pfennigii]|uniref:transposase n=1 Tax=Thiococcus pfennigii TaxID=1057 RepID=UPI001906B5E2